MTVLSEETKELAALLGAARETRFKLWQAASKAAGRAFQTFDQAEDWTENYLNLNMGEEGDAPVQGDRP